MLLHALKSIWLLYTLLLDHTHSFSACDEIDITFLVDTDSIIANSDGIIKLITDVIADGSSEQSGFSVVVYGDSIPVTQNIKIVSLHDTKSDTIRAKAERKVHGKLQRAFQSIIAVSTTQKHKQKHRGLLSHTPKDLSPDIDTESDSQDNTHYKPVKKWTKSESAPPIESSEVPPHIHAGKPPEPPHTHIGDSRTKSIALLPAFKIATGQSRPKHECTRVERLGYDPSDKSIIGDHDNQQVYVIFDHRNRVLQGNGAEMCALFHHLDTNAIKNDDEAPYFMLGSDYNSGEISAVFCEGKIPKQYLKKNTFYRFTNSFAFDKDKTEHIFALTCPAEIKSPEYKGSINVGNHVQYMDLKTIIECDLYYVDNENNKDTPSTLDEKKSFIKVKDYVNDDNTFKLDDTLVAPPGIVPQLRKRDCNVDSVRIIRIEKVESEGKNGEYNVLKLYLRKPGSPMEYIQDANVHGQVKVHEFKKTRSKRSRGKGYNEYDDYGPGSAASDARQVWSGDDIFYSTKDILKGDMDHILERNPFARNIAQNMLKYREKRIFSVAEKLTKVQKIRHRLVDRFPKKKRYLMSKVFASRLMESNMLNPFGISLKDLLSGKIKAEGDIKIIDIDFHREWIAKKVEEELVITEGDTKAMLTVLGIPFDLDMMKKSGLIRRRNRRRRRIMDNFSAGEVEMSASGDGIMEIRFGYIFRFIVGVKFKFLWQIFTPFIDITFVVYIEWDVGTFFYFKAKGEAQFNIDNILHWDKDVRFSIGPVPVLLTPYVDMFASMESVPRPVYTGISCRYNERMELGFRFCTMPGCIPGPIKRKITKHKGCKKHLGLDHREEQDRDYGFNLQCPKPDRVMGFDIKFNVKIGVILYSIVNIHLRMEFVIPFRVMYPTFNSKDCYLPKGLDMCAITKKTQYLKAHFWFSMHLNIYLGIFVDFGNIIGMVLGIFGIPMPAAAAPEFEFKILGPIPLIPKISLGCLDLKGHLLEMDTAFRHACCGDNKKLYEEKSPNPYYDHNYEDNYRHSYSYGDQNPYYDQPHYEDQQFDKKDHFNWHDPYNYNDNNEYSPYYYSPAYHIPKKLRPWMRAWKRYHDTKDNHNWKRKYKINEKHFKKKYPLPFDMPY